MWAATALIAGWFSKRRGMAYGIATSGSSFGGVVLPIMIRELIPRVGFAWAMRASAFLVLGMLIVANLTAAACQPPNPSPISRKALLGPFVDLKLMLVNLGFLILTFGVFIPINYITVETVTHGIDPDLSHYLVATMNAGSLFGRVFAGMIADIAGVYNTFTSVSAVAGILVLAFYIPASSTAAIFVFSVLFGFTSGAYIALIAPLIVKISPLSESGYRIGLLFFLSSVSALVTNPIGGAIVERWHGDYTGMKIYSGIMMLAGAAVIFLSRLIATNWEILVVF